MATADAAKIDSILIRHIIYLTGPSEMWLLS